MLKNTTLLAIKRLLKITLCICMLLTTIAFATSFTVFATNQNSKPENVHDETKEYKLYIRHFLEIDGLKFVDFEKTPYSISDNELSNGYNVLSKAYKKEGLITVNESFIITESDFINGEYTADIHYKIKDGYQAKYNKPKTRSIYAGTFDDVSIIAIQKIKMTLDYKFSAYGALPGMSAHSPDEIILTSQSDGTYSLDWEVPYIKGYNVALDEAPLQLCLDSNNNVIVSDEEHEKAWEKARIKTIEGITYTYDVKTNHITAHGLTKDTKINIYYRRMQGTYTIKHQTVDGKTLLIQDNQPGRVGALTTAKAADIPGYTARLFSQQVIKTNGETVVTILYETADYRIIFDTLEGNYIARQNVKLDEFIDFQNMIPVKKGYTFDGWQYTNQHGDLVDLSIQNNRFEITEQFLKDVKIVGTDSTKSITLVAKWIPDVSSVTVVFWTEDPDYSTTSRNPKTDSGAFSNVGSFKLENLKTEDVLVEEKEGQQVLKEDIQKIIDEQFREKMGYVFDSDLDADGNYNGTYMGEVAVADFYKASQDMPYRILVNDEQGNEVDGTKVAADGSTLIYAFYVRNVYTLRFHYYTDDYKLYNQTVALSYHNSGSIANANAIGTKNIDQSELIINGNPKLEKTVEISAKYGTDLRNLWPNTQIALKEAGSSTNWNFISWATTSGRYNQKYIIDANKANDACSPQAESTILGLYGSMGSEIIANPKNPEEVHELYAYWTFYRSSYYQYNHCYEIPNMTSQDLIGSRVIIRDGNDNTDDSVENNKLYLLSVNDDIFKMYEFSDLLIVDENGKTIDSNREQGYYAIRKYTDPNDNVVKYYAIARRVSVKSTNIIQAQSPSSRLHLSRVNNVPDHNTQYQDNQGGYSGKAIGTEENPYDLYFYYNRNRYTITYMVNDEELGVLELPYGALLKETKYGFKNDDGKSTIQYKMKNDDPILTKVWTPIKNQLGEMIQRDVCPDKSPQGTKSWTFLYWSLGSAGTRHMTWSNDTKTSTIVESNLRLYAQWDAPKYKITFDWNKGVPIDTSQVIPKQQILRGGQSVAINGIIPRLIRNGYILEGWKISKCDSYPQFVGNDYDLNMNIYSDMTIQANWKSDNTKITDYSVRYVTIENGKEIEIAPMKTVHDFYYQNGVEIWEKPIKPTLKGYENYVPITQNESFILKEDAEENILTFYYITSHQKSYTVRYKDYDTQKVVYTTTPVLGHFSALMVYPIQSECQLLNKLGYYLVDNQGQDIETILSLGKNIILNDQNPNQIVEFYVKPISYTIHYLGLEDYQKQNGILNNQSEYKVIDKSFALKNPSSFTKNGLKYIFVGWKLADGTKEINGIDFNGQEVSQNVVIEKGTTGHLTFIATWKISQDHSEDKPQDKPQGKPEDKPQINQEPTESNNTKDNQKVVRTDDCYFIELWGILIFISLSGLLVLINKKKKYE